LKPRKLVDLDRLYEKKFPGTLISNNPFKMVIIKGNYCNFSYAPTY